MLAGFSSHGFLVEGFPSISESTSDVSRAFGHLWPMEVPFLICGADANTVRLGGFVNCDLEL